MYSSLRIGNLQLDISLRSRERTTLSFELDGRTFSQPHLLRRKLGATAGRLNLLSWTAFMNGQPVRIYESQSEAQARFIQQVSNDPVLGNYFPTCLMRKGSYLVVNWIQGKLITWKQVRKDESLLNRITEMQATFHCRHVTTPTSPECFYLYFLNNRLQRFKGLFPIDDAIRKVLAIINNPPSIKESVSHPDVQAENLVLETGTNMLKIIDNELLTQNSYYLIDLFNTHLSFTDKMKVEFLEQYLLRYVKNGGDLRLLGEHGQFFDALWYLRLIGTLLQDGAIASAFRLAREVLEGIAKEHPLIQLTKERFL